MLHRRACQLTTRLSWLHATTLVPYRLLAKELYPGVVDHPSSCESGGTGCGGSGGSGGNGGCCGREGGATTQRRPPKLHVFGHDHLGFGVKHDGNTRTVFMNAAQEKSVILIRSKGCFVCALCVYCVCVLLCALLLCSTRVCVYARVNHTCEPLSAGACKTPPHSLTRSAYQTLVH
jgi:hypothetical protein